MLIELDIDNKKETQKEKSIPLHNCICIRYDHSNLFHANCYQNWNK